MTFHLAKHKAVNAKKKKKAGGGEPWDDSDSSDEEEVVQRDDMSILAVQGNCLRFSREMRKSLGMGETFRTSKSWI